MNKIDAILNDEYAIDTLIESLSPSEELLSFTNFVMIEMNVCFYQSDGTISGTGRLSLDIDDFSELVIKLLKDYKKRKMELRTLNSVLRQAVGTGIEEINKIGR